MANEAQDKEEKKVYAQAEENMSEHAYANSDIIDDDLNNVVKQLTDLLIEHFQEEDEDGDLENYEDDVEITAGAYFCDDTALYAVALGHCDFVGTHINLMISSDRLLELAETDRDELERIVETAIEAGYDIDFEQQYESAEQSLNEKYYEEEDEEEEDEEEEDDEEEEWDEDDGRG